MSDTEKRLKVILDGDASGFQKATKGAKGSTDDLGRALDGLQGQIKKAFSDASGSLGKFGSVLSSMGPAGVAAAAGLGAFAVAAKSSFDALSKLAGQAEKWTNTAVTTGLGVKQVQQLEAFLEDAGFEAGDLEKAMKKLATEVSTGSDALAKFGIDVRELKGLAPEEQLRELARQVTSIVDPTERAAAATEAFGKGGAKALAALQGIASGAYKELGTLSDEAVAELLRVDEELDKAGRAWTNWKNQVLVSLLHAGQAVAKFSTEGFGSAAIVRAINPPKVPTITGEEADSNRGAAVAAAQAEIGAELARKAKAAALAREKKDAAEADSRAAKALAEKTRRENEYAAGRRHNEEQTARQIKEREAAEKKEKDAVDALALTYAKAQVANERGAEAAMQAAEASVGVNEELLAALEALGPPAASADVAMAELVKHFLTLTKSGQLSAEQVRQLKEQIAALAAQGAKVPEVFEHLTMSTEEWIDAVGAAGFALADLFKDASSQAGDFADHAARAFAEVAQGAQNVRAAGGIGTTQGKFAAGGAAAGVAGSLFSENSQFGGALSGAGKGAATGAAVGSLFPGVGTVAGGFIGGAAGALTGWLGARKRQKKALEEMTNAIVQQFGSLKKASAAAKKYGIDLDKALSSKKPDQIAKAMNQLNKELEKRANLEQGLASAQGSVETLQDLTKGSDNEKLNAAVGALAQKVSDELGKAGLGFAATGPLRDSEDFKKTQSVAQATADTVGGLRQAGVVDQGVMDAAATIAQESQKAAFDAAKAAGLDDAAANKASLGAISPLLREQLNASIASGRALDLKTQQLIDEAKANGIDILADPAIEAVDVAKKSLSVLEQIAGKGGESFESRGGKAKGVEGFASGTGGFRDFGTGTTVQLHGWEAVVPRTDYMDAATARQDGAATGAKLAGGGSAGGPVSVTHAPTITINGANQSPEQIATAVMYAMERESHKLNAVIDKRIDRRVR